MATIDKLQGEYGWLFLVAGIIGYDVVAIKSKKAETLSTALWRNLEQPAKGIAMLLAWGWVTHHLFFNNRARTSYKVVIGKHRIITSKEN